MNVNVEYAVRSASGDDAAAGRASAVVTTGQSHRQSSRISRFKYAGCPKEDIRATHCPSPRATTMRSRPLIGCGHTESNVRRPSLSRGATCVRSQRARTGVCCLTRPVTFG